MKILTINEARNIHEGAIIHKGAVIRKGFEGIIIHNSYKYSAGCYYDFKTNKVIIRLGCHHLPLSEWNKNFDNNLEEFPLESEAREKRLMTFNYLKEWATKYLNPKTK